MMLHENALPRRSVVMPGLELGIHALAAKKDVDGQDKPGHERQPAIQGRSELA
jgi:hypothetical protein